MQQSNINGAIPYPVQNCAIPQGPNAVSINIFTPQSYGVTQPNVNQAGMGNGYYPIYGQNMQPNLPYYPQNYNNLINNNDNTQGRSLNSYNETNLVTKTANPETKNETTEKKKTVVPLTDDYIKSLENYMNNNNSKIRLIGAKDLIERFKEDETRKDNPSLNALLNKALRDTSPSVRFLALTALQLGYSVGNNETVTILKEIQSTNKDQIGEDSLLASEILLKLATPQTQEIIQR